MIVSACTVAFAWPAPSIVSTWPFTRTVQSARPARVSGSSALMSQVTAIDGPMIEVGCMWALLENAAAEASAVPCSESTKPRKILRSVYRRHLSLTGLSMNDRLRHFDRCSERVMFLIRDRSELRVRLVDVLWRDKIVITPTEPHQRTRLFAASRIPIPL